jgi:hypothetical protein
MYFGCDTITVSSFKIIPANGLSIAGVSFSVIQQWFIGYVQPTISALSIQGWASRYFQLVS